MARTVEEIMTRDPRTVEIGDSLIDAARAMRGRYRRRLHLWSANARPPLAEISAASPNH